jgi:hypothetical protein
MPRNSQFKQPSGQANGLTCIPPRIHCPATTERVGGWNEIDEIAIDNFLDTLAEVALAITSRKSAQDAGGGEVDQ